MSSNTKTTATPQIKRGRKKKTADYPKRPLSAYNIFYRHERQKMLIEELKKSPLPPHMIREALESGRDRPHRKRHGKIAFQDLVRTVATNWKNIDPMAKKVFEDQAKIDKQRHTLEMDVWKRSHDQLGNKIHRSAFNNVSANNNEYMESLVKIAVGKGNSKEVEIADYSEIDHDITVENNVHPIHLSVFDAVSKDNNEHMKSLMKISVGEGNSKEVENTDHSEIAHDITVENNVHPIEQISSVTVTPDTVGTSAWLISHLDSDCLDFFVTTFSNERGPTNIMPRAA